MNVYTDRNIEKGKSIAQEYDDVCMFILHSQDRAHEEWQEISVLWCGAMKKKENKNYFYAPTESIAVHLDEMRTKINTKYKDELFLLEEKRIQLETDITSAGLNPLETRIFFLRHGLHYKKQTLEEVAEKIYYSDRHVKRILDGAYYKIGAAKTKI